MKQKFFTTKHDVLFPTGTAQPNKSTVQLRFILPSEGGNPLPTTSRYVAFAQFQKESEPKRQMVCDFIEPINTTNGLVKANILFHGVQVPGDLLVDRNKFKLFAGDKVVAVGAVILGEPVSPAGSRFSIP
jgi:hypothetical protein